MVVKQYPVCVRGAVRLVAVCASLGLGLFGCSDDDEGDGLGEPVFADGGSGEPGVCKKQYDSTFEGIQDVIFKRHGCTESSCHGSGKAGGLDLSADVAYQNIFNVKAVAADTNLIHPGDKERSFLYQKLAAGVMPDKVKVSGAAMPNGGPPISEDELHLLHTWILYGAPEENVVPGTEEFLGGAGCLPERKPISIEPLPTPSFDEGLQFEVPPLTIPAGGEIEVCTAQWVDLTGKIPEEHLDAEGKRYFWHSRELRMDAQSHHLILYMSNIREGQLDDPAFGGWHCQGGDKQGDECDPLDQTFCGDGGFCLSEILPSFACAGYGPLSLPNGEMTERTPIGGAQQAQELVEYPEGVFAAFPVKALFMWNLHGFNTTREDHVMKGRLNYLYTSDRRHFIRNIFHANMIFAPNAKPFTEQEVCNDFVLPEGARLFNLNGHMHQRGKRFEVYHPSGMQLYESLLYNDPELTYFNPPLEFDTANEADRTLRYCATYNNGMNPDGTPNTETVTRYSRLPKLVFETGIGVCEPTHCAEGKVGEPCKGVGDDATCDTEPGAGNGFCDACPITGGESTENEMFILFGGYYVPNDAEPPPFLDPDTL